MNLQAVKTTISQEFGFPLVQMNLQKQFDLTSGVETEFVSHWENTKRVRITMHKEVLASIKADPKMENLAFKKKLITPEGTSKVTDKDGNVTEVPIAPYMSLVIITLGENFVASL